MEIEGLSITRCTKLLFGAQRWNSKRFKASVQPSPRVIFFLIRRRRNQYFSAKCFSNKHVQSLARDDSQFTYKDDLPEEPFWLSLMKEAIWAVKSLFIFLVEQPSQLKYIEWPSFQSTLKTATLTLVIVALLIVGLSTVDSILCYLLALLLRKPA